MNGLPDVGDRTLGLAKLFEVHLALNVVFDVGHIALGSAEQGTHRSSDHRQSLWPQDHEANASNEGKLGKANVQHG